MKPGLHDNLIQAILEIEKAIAACNATRTAKGRDKKQKSAELEKLHAEGNSGLDGEGLALRGTFIVNPYGKIVTMEVLDNAIARDVKETLCKLLAAQLVAANPG